MKYKCTGGVASTFVPNLGRSRLSEIDTPLLQATLSVEAKIILRSFGNFVYWSLLGKPKRALR
jgi:hypothetical protein